MLSNNLLSSLPDLHEHMNSLELIRLSNNAFSDVPETVLRLPHLAWLSLAGNPVSGGQATPSSLPEPLRVARLDADFDVDWAVPLGRGTSGTAFPATRRTSGVPAVVKRFAAAAGSDGRALDEVRAALAAAGVPHMPAALAFEVDAADRDNDGGEPALHLVMELVPGNPSALAGPPSLQSCTRSVYAEGLALSTQEKRHVLKCVRAAVDGLTKRGIAHGDVYGHNVLVGGIRDGRKDLVVALSDLGAAWFVPEEYAERVAEIERRALRIFEDEVMGLPER